MKLLEINIVTLVHFNSGHETDSSSIDHCEPPRWHSIPITYYFTRNTRI